MKLHLESNPNAYRITGYGPDYVSVNDERLASSFIVTPDHLLREWAPQGIDALGAAQVEEIAALGPTIVLLGTGTRQRFPASEWLRQFYERGIGIEVMDTAAACRTYNILVSEERSVLAALLFEGR